MKRITFALAMCVLAAASTAATGLQEVETHDQYDISLRPIGTYETGIWDEGAAEIVDYDPATESLFLVNANDGSIDILDVSNPARPSLVRRVPVTAGTANSLAVHGGIVAIALEAEDSQAPGMVAFANTFGEVLSTVMVGALPDMVTFSPNGRYALSANEGEPSDDYSRDPVGSVSIIDLSGGVENLTQDSVTTVSFGNAPRIGDIRTNGPNASFDQDVEPEYVVVGAASR